VSAPHRWHPRIRGKRIVVVACMPRLDSAKRPPRRDRLSSANMRTVESLRRRRSRLHMRGQRRVASTRLTQHTQTSTETPPCSHRAMSHPSLAVAPSRSLCVDAQTAVSASVQISPMGNRWFNDTRCAAQLLGHEVARIAFWITGGNVLRPKWRQQ
jgi:hypothetical protein